MAAKIPEPVRELRPHFTFKLLEKAGDALWGIGGGAVIAGGSWLIARLRENVDYVAIGVLFAIGAAIMYISARLHRRKDQDMEASAAQGSEQQANVKQLEGAERRALTQIDELKEEKAALIKNRDELHSETDRLNQHIKDLMGTIVGLKDKPMPQSNSVQSKAPKIPDIRVSYEDQAGNRAKLVFKTSNPTPVKILRIGPLVSQEMYRMEHELMLLKTVYPDVEIGSPAECQILGVNDTKGKLGTSLTSVLEAGGVTSDSVLIEYADADSNKFSKTFHLHKNSDGSIVWASEESPLPRPKDLSDLRHRLGLLKSAPEQLPYIGELKVLADEARSLKDYLQRIMEEAKNLGDSKAFAALGQPLSLRLFREKTETDPWEWYLQALWRFQGLYMEHRLRAFSYSLPFKSGFLEHVVPTEVDFNSVVGMIGDHQNALVELAKKMKGPYTDSVIFAPFATA
jgi:hypothetical protein